MATCASNARRAEERDHMKGSLRGMACAAAIVLAGAGFVTTAVAQQQDDTQIVPFSDPSRPGKVEIELLNSGGITVRGENRRDVAVFIRPASGRPVPAERPAPPGLRRLTQAPGYEISEERNE